MLIYGKKMGQVLARRQGDDFHFEKIKAHVSNHAQQCQYLTEGKFPRRCVSQVLRQRENSELKFLAFRDLISQAVGLQVHLVTTLMSRTEHFAHDDLGAFSIPPVYGTAMSCSCVPLRPRAVKKFLACTGACRVFFRR